MTESKQESCITKTKKNWKEIYSSPCFWLKATIYLAIAFLVIVGLTTLVTFALSNFTEAISYKYMAPERLGQFGDFLGGTLNPIFGFLTVCLLLWSVFIQRKELKLTRKELKKSAKALKKQVNLTTDEYNRKQLEALLEKNLSKYNDILNKEFPPANCTIRRKIKPDSSNKYNSLNALQKYLLLDLKMGDKIESFGEADNAALCKIHEESYHQLKILLSLYKEISDLTNITSIKIDCRETSTEIYKKLELVNPRVPEFTTQDLKDD